MRSAGTARTSRRIFACLGVGGVAVLVVGVARSRAGFPHYSHWRQFVSELGGSWNPAGSHINTAFIIGGALLTVFLVGLAYRERGIMRVAAVFGAIASTGMSGVGVYPIHDGMDHVYAAAITFTAATIGAGLLLAIALRQRGSAPIAAKAVITVAAAQLGALLFGAVYASHQVATTSLQVSRVFVGRAVLRDNPLIDGSLINPIAIAEWLFFLSAVALLGLVIARELAAAP